MTHRHGGVDWHTEGELPACPFCELDDMRVERDRYRAALHLAYPYLMDMQAAAAITAMTAIAPDESGDALDHIRGICQQVQALLEDKRDE